MIRAGEGFTHALQQARRYLKPVSVDKLSQLERLELAADVARGVLGEVQAAYSEQTSPLLAHYSCAPNYRLALDDLRFAARWAASLAYRAEMAAWHAEPENRGAQTAADACSQPEQRTLLPDDVKRRLDSKPRPISVVTLADAPPGWPHEIVNWSWSETFSRLLETRREGAGLRFDREPGDDDDLAVAP